MNVYEEAAELLRKFMKLQRISPKSLVFRSDSINKPKLLPLLTSVIDNRKALEQCIKHLDAEISEDKFLTMVLVHELAIGRQLGDNKVYRMMISPFRSQIKEWCRCNNIKRKTLKKSRAEDKPRYVKVNTLLTTLDEVKSTLNSIGWKEVVADQSGRDYTQFQKLIRKLKADEYVCDVHVSNLLIMPPGTNLRETSLYKEYKVVLQDKASCFSVLALNPGPDDIVLDCCSAPGNKTLQIAEVVRSSGHVTAVEMQPQRAKVLRQLLISRGAQHVKCIEADIFTVKPPEHSLEGVTHALVDPTCSGSGIEASNSPERDVNKLAALQRRMLLHVIETYPNLKKLVYSTCSINTKENEEVVRSVLDKAGDRFELVHVLPFWTRRGFTSVFNEADKCVRVDYKEDDMTGFFVACFRRKDDTSSEKDVSTAESTSSDVELQSKSKVHKRKIDIDIEYESRIKRHKKEKQRVKMNEKEIPRENYVSNNFVDKSSKKMESVKADEFPSKTKMEGKRMKHSESTHDACFEQKIEHEDTHSNQNIDEKTVKKSKKKARKKLKPVPFLSEPVVVSECISNTEQGVKKKKSKRKK